MQSPAQVADALPGKALQKGAPYRRATIGRALVAVASLVFVLALLIQVLHAAGVTTAGFTNWRPTMTMSTI